MKSISYYKKNVFWEEEMWDIKKERHIRSISEMINKKNGTKSKVKKSNVINSDRTLSPNFQSSAHQLTLQIFTGRPAVEKSIRNSY